MANRQCSIVEYYAEHEGYRCGYCKTSDSNFSHGMWAYSLTVQDYQDLIDRGWRRSGKYCYKPTMNLTCCPQYTIRCDAVLFKLSKSQKSVLKRMKKFLEQGTVKDSESTSTSDMETSSTPKLDDNFGDVQAKAAMIEQKLSSKGVPNVVFSHSNTGPASSLSESQKISLEPMATDSFTNVKGTASAPQLKQVSPTDKERSAPKPGTGPDPTKPPCKKAKLLRLQRREEKRKQNCNQVVCSEKKEKNVTKSLEEFLAEVNSNNAAHNLQIELLRSNPSSNRFLETLEESYAVYNKYQQTIHNDPPDKCKLSQYKRFLVESPLEKFKPSDGPCPGYGSFHQHYRLDGKLIAVGVLDILQYCVSSVYFYYDPDYSFLSLGTYASLRELAFTRELQSQNPELRFYYMGFYIHSCPKMRYKGNYTPSYLLCPETFTWHPIEKCILKLDNAKYSRFENNPNKGDDNLLKTLDEVLVLHRHEGMPYYLYRLLNTEKSDEAEVRQYASLVGAKCARRILLYRS